MTTKLKEMIIKIAKEWHPGLDLNGDIICIFDKKYYVNITTDKVVEVE